MPAARPLTRTWTGRSMHSNSDMVMSRLGSYSRQNSVARALKEMERIEKTIFLLKYFGKSGNLREKDLQDQLQRASCLNILLNVVVIWNTVYLSRAIEHKRQTTGLDESMLKHISPLNWNHQVLEGQWERMELRDSAPQRNSCRRDT